MKLCKKLINAPPTCLKVHKYSAAVKNLFDLKNKKQKEKQVCVDTEFDSSFFFKPEINY